MAKGLQSWSVKESGSPVSSAEILTGTWSTDTAQSFSSTTRAIMGIKPTAGAGNLTVTLAGGGTVLIPNATIDSVFAPGSIVPFACTSLSFSAGETDFSVMGLF